MPPLQIVADADIPLVARALDRYGAVRALPGRALDRAACRDADVLLVRSVTPVGAPLLEGAAVRFVGTATAGTDHVDAAWLAAHGVAFADAPGSNAESVVEWALAALLALAAGRGEGLRGRTLGVVGCGHVGGRLGPRAAALGLRVLPCDPPLAAAADARGEAHPYVPYARVLEEADAVTFHTPLARGGAHPTHHLLDAAALARLRPGAWVLNASRGAVVDGAALADALGAGRVGAAALDVWEGEPAPDPALARRAAFATPHVAGYGYDAKLAGARMMEDALRAWLAAQGAALPPPFDWDAAATPAAPLVLDAPPPPADGSPAGEAVWLDRLARGAYDLRADDARFRAAVLGADGPAARADAFTRLRRTYPARRAWPLFSIRGAVPGAFRTAVEGGLGMTVAEGPPAETRDSSVF